MKDILTSSQFEALRQFEAILTKLYEQKYMTRKEREYPQEMLDVYSEIYYRYNKKKFKPVSKGCSNCGRHDNWAYRLSKYYFSYKNNNHD